MLKDKNFYELDVVSRTLYGEARGEYNHQEGGLSSLIAVGNVILNRSFYPHQFGNSFSKICQQPFQFSCWNMQDPNYSVITSVQRDNAPIFDLCWTVAEHLITGRWPDLTQGSDHYHAAWMPTLPLWARGRKPKIKIGQHLFYKLCG